MSCRVGRRESASYYLVQHPTDLADHRVRLQAGFRVPEVSQAGPSCVRVCENGIWGNVPYRDIIPTQPPTVACKNGSSVGMCTSCIHVFASSSTDLHAQSALIDKISASELRRKFIKSALLVGYQILTRL